MAGQGFTVDLERGGESTMTFDEASAALATFADRRVMVSIADTAGHACAGVAGVVKRRLVIGDDEAETGAITVMDIGVDGVVIVSRAAFVGARWRHTDEGDVLALQNGSMLLTVRQIVRRPTDEEV